MTLEYIKTHHYTFWELLIGQRHRDLMALYALILKSFDTSGDSDGHI